LEIRTISETAATSASQPSAQTNVVIGATTFDRESPILDVILASLAFDGATNVVTVDLFGKSSIGDFMVIASASSARLVGSVCEKLSDRIKTLRGERPRSEGVEAGDWALIDVGDVIVHVFRPEVREYYALEKMWAPELAVKRKNSA
jgi:ribosome-associated protein